MALYNYSKYNVAVTQQYTYSFGSSGTDNVSSVRGFRSFSFNSSTGTFSGSGTESYYYDGTVYTIRSWDSRVIRWAYYAEGRTRTTIASVQTVNVDSRGSLVQSNIVAENGTYPSNGKHTDGYWYVIGSIYVPPNNPPTTPSSITVPTTIQGGSSFSVSWGASSDADGNSITYYLYRSVNGGSFTSIQSNSLRSKSESPLSTWNTVAYRVMAYDGMAYSSYRTSATTTVTHNTAPTTPSSITVPELRSGNIATITWGASTDVDGDSISYRLQRSVNGGVVTQIYGESGLSYNDIPQADWNTVLYRVRAYDGTTYSDYQTSSTITVKHFPELIMRVDGTLKTSVDGWVRIDGALRRIDNIWIRVGGILKQIGSVVAGFNNPLDISDCALWLDFSDTSTIIKSGGFVSSVNDKSGNNNHITQNTSSAQPTSALGSLYFYNGDYMTTNYNLNVSGNEPRTIIVVAKPASSSGNIYGYGLNSNSAMFDGLSSNSAFCIHANGGGMDNLAIAPSFVVNKVQAFTIHYDGQNIISGVNKNYSTPLAMSLNTGNSAMYIGDGIYAGYNTFEGAIMEVIVYKKALNNMELDNIYDYLSNKHYIV